MKLDLRHGPGVVHRTILGGLTLAEAMEALDADGFVIAWSPRWAGFVDGAPPEDCFEARGCDRRRELRWYRSPGDPTGTAVVVGDPPEVWSGRDGAESEEVSFAAVVEGVRSLVWGTTSAGGALREQRVGSVRLPGHVAAGVGDGKRLVLTGVEYLDRLSGSGNAVVVEERLTGWRWES